MPAVFNPVIVAPTFNNARMLREVLEQVGVHGLPVIVVDDGCTDATPKILRGWSLNRGTGQTLLCPNAAAYHGPPARAECAERQQIDVVPIRTHHARAGGPWYEVAFGGTEQGGVSPASHDESVAVQLRDVITHPRNRGKAQALRSGFRRATERGFTHAITIDTDGQLDLAQIADLFQAARQHPDALIVGDRDMTAPDYPAKNRIGRRVSNLIVRLESGAIVSDSQCGFRVYPLPLVNLLDGRAGRYGYETEVLTRAAWAGAEIRHVPVSCAYDIPGGRISHLKPGKDTLHHFGMHLCLTTRSLLPLPVRRVDHPDHPRETGTMFRRLCQWFSPRRAWRQVRDTPEGRSQFALALAIGVFIANLPLYGVQTLLSLYAARRFKVHPLPVVVGSHLSTPPVGPVLIVAAIAVGHLMLRGRLPDVRHFDPADVGYAQLARSLMIEWALGSVVVGGVLAGVAYAAARATLHAASSADEPEITETEIRMTKPEIRMNDE